MKILPVLLKDGYKVGHVFQYPSDTTMVYSNLTPRNTRRVGTDNDSIVFFGLQYFIREYLMDQFDHNFFDRDENEVVAEYKRRIDNYLGVGAITVDHIRRLHQLGYLPIKIKAVPEGTFVPYGVPALTIVNTHPEFFWLTNMLETLMSSVLWKASTSATTAMLFRRTFEQYAHMTGASKDFVLFQGHDFSFRGMCGVEDAAVSGAAHLLLFRGTDTIPAIDFLEQYYEADSDIELVGVSVAATEHSVMCMGSLEDEIGTFRRLVTEVYPAGIVSVVSDTWDLWRVMTEYLPTLKDEIMARDGKLVIRPDSGDPELILCGDPDADPNHPSRFGVLELLWNTFGGTVNAAGFRELDPHIGAIYGDGISPARQNSILTNMLNNKFASTNIVMGLGSYTYQYVTRDIDGWAMKATAGHTVSRGAIEIFKDPITDDGGKRSAAGLLCVVRDDSGKLVLEQRVTPEREAEGVLQTVFQDGFQIGDWQTMAGIRAWIEEQL